MKMLVELGFEYGTLFVASVAIFDLTWPKQVCIIKKCSNKNNKQLVYLRGCNCSLCKYVESPGPRLKAAEGEGEDISRERPLRREYKAPCSRGTFGRGAMKDEVTHALLWRPRAGGSEEHRTLFSHRPKALCYVTQPFHIKCSRNARIEINKNKHAFFLPRLSAWISISGYFSYPPPPPPTTLFHPSFILSFF